jgi:hypothetical protein
MALAEALAAISATMQAFDLWAKYGGPKASVIQTLNLEYQPQRFHAVERELRASNPSLADFFDKFSDAIVREVTQCRDQVIESIPDEDLPEQVRDRIARAGRACACKALKRFRDFAPGESLPQDLAKLWHSFRCQEFFDGKGGGSKDPSLAGAVMRTPTPA